MDNQQERNEADLNWLAGIWEGEGWFTMSTHRSKTCKSKGIAIACGLANTDIFMINCIVEILKKNWIAFNLATRSLLGRLGKKPQFHIKITGIKRVKRFLELLVPYLRSKKDRAEIVLKYAKYRLSLPSHNVKISSYEWELVNQLRLFNGSKPLLSSETNTPNTRYTVKIESELQRKLQSLVECQAAS